MCMCACVSGRWIQLSVNVTGVHEPQFRQAEVIRDVNRNTTYTHENMHTDWLGDTVPTSGDASTTHAPY